METLTVFPLHFKLRKLKLIIRPVSQKLIYNKKFLYLHVVYFQPI